MKGKGEKADKKQAPWLLIKERDAHARPAAEFSVVDKLLDSVKALGAPTLAAAPAAAVAAPKPRPSVKAARPTLPRARQPIECDLIRVA